MTGPDVRAVVGAVRVPDAQAPLDTVHWTVRFPAEQEVDDARLGVIRPDLSKGPLPLVIVLPNFNCPPELYAWWARHLARHGAAAVTFTFVADLFGGRAGFSSGLDLTAVTPDAYEARANPSPMLRALIDDLAQRSGTPGDDLEGAIDPSRTVLVGHSSGGTLALLAAGNPHLPEVAGALSYGGHTRAQQGLGWEAGQVIRPQGGVPRVMVAGTEDGVVGAVARAQHLGEWTEHPIAATHALAPEPRWLTIIEGADHYAVAEGYDGTLGRGYLEQPGSADPAEVRTLVAELSLALLVLVRTGDRSVLDSHA